MRKLSLLVCLCAIFVGSPAWADSITFDEITVAPMTPIFPTPVTVNGVTFSFVPGADPSPNPLCPDACYNSTLGPTDLQVTLLNSPALEGSAYGTLHLAFVQPIDHIKFAIALDRVIPLPVGFTVSLFDPSSVFISSFPTATSVNAVVTEAMFEYFGGPVGSASLTFDPSTGALAGGRFAMDNLDYDFAPEAPAVPEPASLSLLGLGAVGLRFVRRRQSK